MQEKTRFTINEQLTKREKLIADNSPAQPHYFNIYDYLNLSLYSLYIFITPRGIGKTTSCFQLAADVYNATGEYTIWLRTNEKQTQSLIRDMKNRKSEPWWEEHWVMCGDTLIDNKTGDTIIQFMSLSTAHNFASIKGDNCFGIVYDEFLPRTRYEQASYDAFVDLCRTFERSSLLTVILIANATNIESEILSKLDLWIDQDKYVDLKSRLYFERIQEWENPPEVQGISTSRLLAQRSPELEEYMYSAEFLKDDSHWIIPLSRLTIDSWDDCFVIESEYYTLGTDNLGRIVITAGQLDKNLTAYNMTMLDSFTPHSGTANPYSVEQQMAYLFRNLKNGNVIFTSPVVRNVICKFALGYTPRKL